MSRLQMCRIQNKLPENCFSQEW